jgi:hypothetical protein
MPAPDTSMARDADSGNPRTSGLPMKLRRAPGRRSGDYIAFDPRVEITNGFVRSPTGDKACVACR